MFQSRQGMSGYSYSHLPLQAAGVPGAVQECCTTELLCKGQGLVGITEIAEQRLREERMHHQNHDALPQEL